MTLTPPKSHRTWMLPLKSVAFGTCVFLLGSALAAWLTRHNVHGFLAFVDDLAAGIAAGLVVLLYERWRQREVDRKLQTIRLMNHHVRNALQIISAASYASDGTEPPAGIRDAVRRIEWALREVLPGEVALSDELAGPSTPKTHKKESAA